MIELMCLISSDKDDKSIKPLYSKYNMPFNFTIYGEGTASSSLLEYFGLEKVKKYIYFSLIDQKERTNILQDIKENLKLEKEGNGICFTIPLSSSTKHILNKINDKENTMDQKLKEENQVEKDNKKEYHLIVTIITEGYAETVMNTAKNAGAGGGTLINGRSLYQDKSKNMFLGFSIEPEKDVILIVADTSIKNNIMDAIVQKTGLKTKGGAIVFSLPISDAVGLYE